MDGRSANLWLQPSNTRRASATIVPTHEANGATTCDHGDEGVKLKDALPQLLGKRICGAVVKEGDRMPRMQVFLIFDDDTYYEFYTDSMIYGTGGIDDGDIDHVRQYMSGQTTVFECHAETPYKNDELFD